MDQTKPNRIIALDCDDVLLDYTQQFKTLYENFYKVELNAVSPYAYHSYKVFGIEWTQEEKKQFRDYWDIDGWRSMPPIHGALEACHRLVNAGYELVCVTAMPEKFSEHRLENFRTHGFPISRLYGVDYDKTTTSVNPKKEIIEEIHPLVFVDDLKRNFADLEGVHTKLVHINRNFHDNPWAHVDPFVHVEYDSLWDFVDDFLRDENDHGRMVSWAERN